MAAGSITLASLKATADPLRAKIGEKLAMAHQLIPVGTAAGAALADLHTALGEADDAYVGLFPTGTVEPQDGGDPNKRPPE